MLNPRGGEKKKVLFLSPKSTHSIQADIKCSLIKNDNHKGRSTEPSGNMGKRRKTLIWGWVTSRKDLVKIWNLNCAEDAVKDGRHFF